MLDYDFSPDWAIGKAFGQLMVGAQLPTKDGRRCGNAYIIKIREPSFMFRKRTYHILTDAGTAMMLTEEEVMEMFHRPMFVADVDEVLAKFFKG